MMSQGIDMSAVKSDDLMKSIEGPSAPQLSVVVASIVGPPFIDQCLASLAAEAGAVGAEVIVVTSGSEEYAERIERAFPWARVVRRAERQTVPELRRSGVMNARGKIVAIIEE